MNKAHGKTVITSSAISQLPTEQVSTAFSQPTATPSTSSQPPLPQELSKCYWKDVWEKLYSMRSRDQLCDLSLYSDEGVLFRAHSTVLAASSSVFYNHLVEKNLKENSFIEKSSPTEHRLPGVSADVLNVVLDFIYGIAPESIQDFKLLQKGALKLGISSASLFCSSQLLELERLNKKLTESSVSRPHNSDIPLGTTKGLCRELLLADRSQTASPSKSQDLLLQCPYLSNLSTNSNSKQIPLKKRFLLKVFAQLQQEESPSRDSPSTLNRTNMDHHRPGKDSNKNQGFFQDPDEFSHPLSLVDMDTPCPHLQKLTDSTSFVPLNNGNITNKPVVSSKQTSHNKQLVNGTANNASETAHQLSIDSVEKSNSLNETCFTKMTSLPMLRADSPVAKYEVRNLIGQTGDTENKCLVSDVPESRHPIFDVSESRHPVSNVTEGKCPVSGMNGTRCPMTDICENICPVTNTIGSKCPVSDINDRCPSSCSDLPDIGLDSMSPSTVRAMSPTQTSAPLIRLGNSENCVHENISVDNNSFQQQELVYYTPTVDQNLRQLLQSPDVATATLASQISSALTCDQSSQARSLTFTNTRNRIKDWPIALDSEIRNYANPLPASTHSNKENVSKDCTNYFEQNLPVQYTSVHKKVTGDEGIKYEHFNSPGSVDVLGKKREGDKLTALQPTASQASPPQPSIVNPVAFSMPYVDQQPDNDRMTASPLCVVDTQSFQSNFPISETISMAPLPHIPTVVYGNNSINMQLMSKNPDSNTPQVMNLTENSNPGEDLGSSDCIEVSSGEDTWNDSGSDEEVMDTDVGSEAPSVGSEATSTARMNNGQIHSLLKEKSLIDPFGKRMYYCVVNGCDYSNRGKEYVQSHLFHRHGHGQPEIQCSECAKKYFSELQLRTHCKQTHSAKGKKKCKEVKCEDCNAPFRTMQALQMHQLKVHGKGKLFACEDCEFKSPRKKDLQGHMISQHKKAPPGVRIYECEQCDYKCIDRNRFCEHEASHSQDKSYKCSECGNYYATRRGLRNHMKYHSNERPYVCDICQANFKVRAKLRDHIRLVHEQKGEKPYRCGHCDFQASVRGNVNQHIRNVHKGLPILVIDTLKAYRKHVKDYDYANLKGSKIREVKDASAAGYASIGNCAGSKSSV